MIDRDRLLFYWIQFNSWEIEFLCDSGWTYSGRETITVGLIKPLIGYSGIAQIAPVKSIFK